MAGGVNFARNQKTLSDWVRDFRLKKIQMKRKVRQGSAELRVCAILATALRSAEKELRQKQQERFVRWSSLQSKLVQNKSDSICWSTAQCGSEINKKQQEDDERRRQEVAELWKCEIASLDDFMRSLSSQKCVASS